MGAHKHELGTPEEGGTLWFSVEKFVRFLEAVQGINLAIGGGYVDVLMGTLIYGMEHHVLLKRGCICGFFRGIY